MNTAKFNGYPFTLHTSLPVEECRRRLAAEFSDPRGRWQHARSDGKFLGWREKATFLIYLSGNYDPISVATDHGDAGYARRCTVSFRADAAGTTIIGRYAYTRGENLLLRLIFTTIFGIIFGILLTVLGVVFLVQARALNWPLFMGIALLIGCIVFLRDQSDGDFPRERDQIARYLMGVLEASAVSEPIKPAKR
jgi:hypothetical protein